VSCKLRNEGKMRGRSFGEASGGRECINGTDNKSDYNTDSATGGQAAGREAGRSTAAAARRRPGRFNISCGRGPTTSGRFPADPRGQMRSRIVGRS